MTKIIVADTGPLIAFAHLELFALLPSIVGTVIVPKAVAAECFYVPSRPDAILIQDAFDRGYLSQDDRDLLLNESMSPSLGDGEQAAIHLAQEILCPILLDDRVARRIAKAMGLTVVGTAGVLLKGKQLGKLEAVMPLLNKLQLNGYHFSPALIAQIAKLAGES